MIFLFLMGCLLCPLLNAQITANYESKIQTFQVNLVDYQGDISDIARILESNDQLVLDKGVSSLLTAVSEFEQVEVDENRLNLLLSPNNQNLAFWRDLIAFHTKKGFGVNLGLLHSIYQNIKAQL